jgi:hypothetical protein
VGHLKGQAIGDVFYPRAAKPSFRIVAQTPISLALDFVNWREGLLHD